MRHKPNTFLIGLFMLIGMITFGTILGIFVKNRFFNTQTTKTVMFFEESLNGLSVGSPVVFKGVQVGKVSNIEIDTNLQDLSFRIPVYVTMDVPENSHKENPHKISRKLLLALIDKGLRAHLMTQSYLTGQLMIELEIVKNAPKIAQETGTEMIEIPTILSPLGTLSKGLKDLPISDSVKEFNQFFSALNQQMPLLKETILSINHLFQYNAVVVADSLDNINRAALRVGEAALSLKNFTDYMEQHPEAFLQGKRGEQ